MPKYFFISLFLLTFQAVSNMKLYKWVKDIASFQIARENILVGYGLVIGLEGTGDSLKSIAFTSETLTNMLERLGVNIRDQQKSLSTKNTAAVIVTSNLPSFAPQGSKIDIKISSIGDAKSLKGGTLVVTPLKAADGNVYAVGQGSITAFNLAKNTARSGNLTSGMISNGAIVEKEVDLELKNLKELKLILNKGDFSSAKKIESAINRMFPNSALAESEKSVRINVPARFQNEIVGFISIIEQLKVPTDSKAMIVLDIGNGVITITENVTISPCVISQGDIIMTINKQPKIRENILGVLELDQPNKIQIDNGSKNFAQSEGSATLEDVKSLLSSMNLPTSTIISVIQNLHASGVINAELVIR